jgi:hypothetical protein
MAFQLYLMCHRVDSLVASQLSPEEFGAYMAVGVMKQTRGMVIFFEVDPAKLGAAFDLDRARRECVPHPDGRPKRSKYISIYRTLERVPTAALGNLYLSTRDGRVLGLSSRPYDVAAEPTSGVNMYLELCPTHPLVVSRLGPGRFIEKLTDPSQPVSVPRLLLADLLIDQEPDGRLATYLPYRDPDHIVSCIRELNDAGRVKDSKTVDRTPMIEPFFRTIARGFFVGCGTDIKYYPFPTRDELEDNHHWWWRSASMA